MYSIATQITFYRQGVIDLITPLISNTSLFSQRIKLKLHSTNVLKGLIPI